MFECEFLCRKLQYIFGWHVRAYIDGECVLDLPPAELLFDPVSPFIDELLSNERGCFVKLCASNRYFMVLSSPADCARIVIGPIGNMSVTRHSAQGELYEYGVYDELLDEYFSYRNASSCFSHSRLSSIAAMLQYALSGEKVSYHNAAFDEKEYMPLKQPMDKTENVGEIIAFECEYLAFIELGNTQKLAELFESNPYWSGAELMYDAMLNQIKLRVSSYVFYASRAAMRAGVQLERAYDVCEQSVFQIDSALSTREVYSLFRAVSLDFAGMVATLNSSRIVERVREYVLKNSDRRVDTQELADLVGLSRPYFCKKFREDAGMTAAQFVLELKLEQAKRMLERTNSTLAQIAERLAFSSQSHFQNSFKKRFGITPGEYRTDFRSSISRIK